MRRAVVCTRRRSLIADRSEDRPSSPKGSAFSKWLDWLQGTAWQQALGDDRRDCACQLVGLESQQGDSTNVERWLKDARWRGVPGGDRRRSPAEMGKGPRKAPEATKQKPSTDKGGGDVGIGTGMPREANARQKRARTKCQRANPSQLPGFPSLVDAPQDEQCIAPGDPPGRTLGWFLAACAADHPWILPVLVVSRHPPCHPRLPPLDNVCTVQRFPIPQFPSSGLEDLLPHLRILKLVMHVSFWQDYGPLYFAVSSGDTAEVSALHCIAAYQVLSRCQLSCQLSIPKIPDFGTPSDSTSQLQHRPLAHQGLNYATGKIWAHSQPLKAY